MQSLESGLPFPTSLLMLLHLASIHIKRRRLWRWSVVLLPLPFRDLSFYAGVSVHTYLKERADLRLAFVLPSNLLKIYYTLSGYAQYERV